MSTATVDREVPTAAVAVVAALLVLSFAYSVVVTQQFLLWALAWGLVFAVVVVGVVVYLLYRLVVAAEDIADSL